MADRFLIQFDTNYTQAIAALDALYRKVQQVEAAMNRLGAQAGRAGAAGGVFNATTQSANQAAAAISGIGRATRASEADANVYAQRVKGIKREIAELERQQRTFARQGQVFPDNQIRRTIRLYDQLGVATRTATNGFVTLRDAAGNIERIRVPSLANIEKAQQRLFSTLASPEKVIQGGFRAASNAVAAEITRLQGRLVVQQRAVQDAFNIPDNFRGQQRSLQNLVNTYQRLSSIGVPVTQQLAQAEQRLAQVSTARAAAQVRSVRVFGDAQQRLISLAGRQRIAVEQAFNVPDNFARKETTIRRLTDTYRRMAAAGLPVTQQLADAERRLSQATADRVASQVRSVRIFSAAQERLIKQSQAQERAVTRAFADPTALRQQETALRNLEQTYRQMGAAGLPVTQQLADAQNRLTQVVQTNAAARSRTIPIVDRETQALARQLEQVEKGIARRALFGRLPTERQLGTALQTSTDLQARGFNTAADKVQKYTRALERGQFVQEGAGRSFAVHTRRIAEGILVYEAFARAVQGAVAAVSLVANIDRETERLRQVLGGLSETQADDFLKRMGEIAFDTNTPLQALVSTTDLVAGVLKDMEGDTLANVEAFQQLAGQFQNVLGPGRSQEAVTAQLAQITRALDLSSVEELQGFLDLLVSAGDRSAFQIENIFDALAEVAPNAKEAGLDIQFLTLALDFLVRNTPATGAELGNIFKTALGRLVDKDRTAQLQETFDTISGGFLQITDASGNVKDATTIFLELINAVQSGAVTAQGARSFFQDLVGPLAPGQVGIVTKIFDAFLDSVNRGPEVFGNAKGALQELSDALVDTLAGRFGQFVRRIEQGLLDSKDAIEDFANTLLNLGNAVVDVIGFLGSDFFSTLARVGLAFGALKLISIISNFRLLKDVMIAVNTIFKTTTITIAATGGSLRALPPIIAGVTGAVGALLTALGPLLAAFAALQVIEFASNISNQFDQINAQAAGAAAGKTLPQLEALRDALAAEVASTQKGPIDAITNPIGFFTGNLEAGTAGAQLDKVIAAIELLKSKGEGATLTLKELNNIFGEEAVAASNAASAIAGADGSLASGTPAYILRQQALEQTANALDPVLVEAEKKAAEAARLNTELAQERVSAIEDLDARLSDGSITQEQYAQGIDQINRASELASQLTAAYGEKLGVVPQLEAAAAAGADDLSRALFQQILQSGDNIGAIEEMIKRLIALGTAYAGIQQLLAVSPLIIQTAVVARDDVFEAANPEVGTHRNFAQNLVGADAIAQLRAIQAEITRILTQSLGAAFSNNSNAVFGTGGAGSSAGGAARRQTDVLDIGDLKPSQISKIIEIATALRDKIPGAAEDSAGAVVALIKDAQFLRTVRGIDDRLLRLAMEELTQQMEEANRLAEDRLKQDQILRNLTVNTGPLGALISQPTAFGLAGSIASGTGLNFDPSQGNFVINVPVELKGLEPAKLQELIYNIIAKAIRDSLRL